MKDPIEEGNKEHEAFVKRMEDRQREVRKKASPIQREFMDKVEAEVLSVGNEFFGEDSYERENQLRQQYRTLLKDPSFNITDIETLLKEAKELRKQTGPGKTIMFDLFSKNLVLSATDQIMLAEDYVTLLEKTIIDISSNSQFTNLGFFDLIKLAFKNLLGRKNAQK